MQATNNYRTYLRQVWKERLEKNKLYSLRAMAKQIGITPSLLSDVMHGKRNFSLEAAVKVGEKLSLKDADLEYFCLSVQIESIKSPEIRAMISDRMKMLKPDFTVQDLNLDLFKAISSWYYIPILEMTYLKNKNFSFTPKLISKRLGISVVEAETAIERLLRLELLEKTSDQKYRKTKNHILFSSEVPNSALRRYHTQMLEKAIVSIESQTPQEKIIGSETFAFDPEQIGEAKKIIQDFFKKMVNLAEKSKKKTEIYHLNTVLFRITEKEGVPHEK